jgi:periplasmic divalent cation tolerance protein
MTDKLLVLSTCETLDAARRIARHLVDRQLAACVNLVPAVESIYRWKGAVETAGEILLLIKTSRTRFDELQAELRQVHPYEVPECVAVPVETGSSAYLTWWSDQLSG